MSPTKLFTIPDSVTPGNFSSTMDQAITLELATIPTYLSTYYSINRAQKQDPLYDKILHQLKSNSMLNEDQLADLAQELKLDVLVYANKTAALIMSVVIEEMLHLSLASNVKQAIAGPPHMVSIAKVLTFPAQLDGHQPEFPINAAPLSLNQLATFLRIESPDPFLGGGAPPNDGETEYKTIGRLYKMIEDCVTEYYNKAEDYHDRPQLVPIDSKGNPTAFYSQNSINTVHYDRNHNPSFSNADDSGGLVHVTGAPSAVAAMKVICHQGEGNVTDPHHSLKFDPETGMPIPLEIKDGKVDWESGDFDTDKMDELSHYAKFLEAYSFGVYFQEKFSKIQGLDDFFSYFVYDQPTNPKQATYDALDNKALSLCNKLGSAIFTYTILMVESCYYQDEDTQFEVFMYGVHKSMIWLLSGVGNAINEYTYTDSDGNTRTAAMSFEYYPFEDNLDMSPKDQLIALAFELAGVDSDNWGWIADPKYASYWPSLPDVGLNHSVQPNVPHVPST